LENNASGLRSLNIQLVTPTFNELYFTHLLYLGCGYYFNYLHCPVDRSVDPQHFALLRQEGREQQRERLSALCSPRSNLHVLVHIRIPGENPSAMVYFQNYALNMINCRHLIYKSRAPEVNLRAGSSFTRRIFFLRGTFSRQNTIHENNNERNYPPFALLFALYLGIGGSPPEFGDSEKSIERDIDNLLL
jgi:hypothetical protein